MRVMSAIAPVIFLSLMACDGSADQPAAVKHIGVRNALHEQLTGLSDLNRGLALRRAIQDSRFRCKRVEAEAFQQDYKALKMWTARCSDTGDYAVYLAASGDVQVRTCADTKTLGLPECRLPGGEQAPSTRP